MDRYPDPNTILDRHQKAVADILKRFLNMVIAATEPIDEGYTPEKASLNQMQMETETAALVSFIPAKFPPRLPSTAHHPPRQSCTWVPASNHLASHVPHHRNKHLGNHVQPFPSLVTLNAFFF